MMRSLFITTLFLSTACVGQELFVYTQPASVLPAKSVTALVATQYVPLDKVYDRSANRLLIKVAAGLGKKWMVAAGASYANLHTASFRSEAFWAGTQFRFFSADAFQRHFRLAAFANAGYTQAHFHFDDVGLQGDKTGAELGLVATQLVNRFAVSGRVSHVQLLDRSRFSNVVYLPQRIYQAMTYSLSAGYRGFPARLVNYRQGNINFYTELLAQQTLPHSRYFIDAAPTVQLIFGSTTKVSAGPRLQVAGTMERVTKTSWLLTVERSFLNVFR